MTKLNLEGTSMMDRRDFLKSLGMGGAGAALLGTNLASADLNINLERRGSTSNTINILFDSWSSQVMFQRKPFRYPRGVSHPRVTRRRLNTILGAMQSYGLSTGMEWNVSFTNSRITQRSLAGVDVYVSLTRFINEPSPPPMGTGFSYKDFELRALEDFVMQGGGILLMSDHGATDKVPNWTENDAALASVFGVTLMNIFVTDQPDPNCNAYMVMEMNPDLRGDKRICHDEQSISYLANQVARISSHDSCIILPPPDFTPLAMFPEGATAFDIAVKDHIPLPSPYFSILVPFGTGNVIVVGNSGMVGDYGSPDPAPGIVNLENNLMFFLNCVSFLAGLTGIPCPGQGPC